MRKIVTMCALLLAIGAAGVSAQAAQQGQQAQQKPKTEQTKARHHRRHKTTTRASASAKENAAVQQSKEAKEDVNAANKHITKAEEDVKAAEKKGATKADTAGMKGTKHARRHHTRGKPKSTTNNTMKKTSGSSYSH